jgi:hypothetical protein
MRRFHGRRAAGTGLSSVAAALLLAGSLGCAPAESNRSADAPIQPGDPVLNSTRTVARYGPIITPAMLPGNDGDNINGPSLIRTPDWLPNRLGNYYLYFASHTRGEYIRLAYADQIAGPWTIYKPGTLRVHKGVVPAVHVGSPDVVVDEQRREIRMYFHGAHRAPNVQGTFVATSADGLLFEVKDRLGPSYGRVLRHDGWHYLFMGASGQRVFRSADGVSGFERGPMVLPRRRGAAPYSRHLAVQRAGDVLRVFYTRKRDAPERILMGTIDLAADWTAWKVSGEVEILRPDVPFEGADLAVRPSRHGPAQERENALRDPAVYEEAGRTWLLYTYAGEGGIALAELLF